jgi:hypothetical protein
MQSVGGRRSGVPPAGELWRRSRRISAVRSHWVVLLRNMSWRAGRLLRSAPRRSCVLAGTLALPACARGYARAPDGVRVLAGTLALPMGCVCSRVRSRSLCVLARSAGCRCTGCSITALAGKKTLLQLCFFFVFSLLARSAEAAWGWCPASTSAVGADNSGGEGGIRTHGTPMGYNGFRGRRLQPLGHLSAGE